MNLNDKPTIEQLETFLAPTWSALVEGSAFVYERLREIFDTLRPDVIVEDNVVAFPAVPASGIPGVWPGGRPRRLVVPPSGLPGGRGTRRGRGGGRARL